jgi:TRAP-type C4-dicarboxylate transport system substrate-binding protein
MSVRKLLALAVVVIAAAVPLGARAPMANVVIRLATQAPVNSAWHKALLDMGAEWEAKTAGRVKLNVYPGGTQGSEEATVKMMRPGVDQLQGNLIMASGLSNIDDSFNAFGMPFFFASDAEARYVEDKLQPMFEQRLNAKGFKMLCWGTGGWVQLFSKQPLKTLADVKKAKMYTSQGDDRMVQWYKANGFNPVALAAGDIPAQLSTGMIDTAPSPPYVAAVLQMFRTAKYMLDIRVGPLVGALVLTNEAWNKIDAADRPAIVAAAKTFETRIMTEVPKQDADSVATMTSRGLTVTTPDAAAAAAFRAEADRMVATMRGNMVPADIYDAAVRERDAFRKTKK